MSIAVPDLVSVERIKRSKTSAEISDKLKLSSLLFRYTTCHVT